MGISTVVNSFQGPNWWWYAIAYPLGFFILYLIIRWKKKASESWDLFVFSCKALFNHLLIPGMIFIIMLLGALHAKYQYTSYFDENMTQVLGGAGHALKVGIYDTGSKSPDLYIWICIAFFIVSTYFVIDDIIEFKKKQKKNVKAIEDIMNDANLIDKKSKVVTKKS